MSDPIIPALMPEEWEDGQWSRRDGTNPTLHDGTGGLVLDGVVVDDQAERHAIAALALHGHPFGFTWEDVDALRSETYQLAERLAQGHFWSQLQAPRADFWSQLQSGPSSNLGAQLDGTALRLRTLRSLADRIAALLPPRGA